MGKLVRLNSIARPITYEDRQKKIQRETEQIKQKHKELYDLAKKMVNKKEE